MKKVLYTLNIGNYEPSITKLTYPYIEKYADKIGAEFQIITKRKFPDKNITYEKMQLYELSQDNDWSYFVDSDAVIHPDTPDYALLTNKNTVIYGDIEFAAYRWKYDKYFIRDGRHFQSCNWFVIWSNLCSDLWEIPKDITYEQAVSSIYMRHLEKLYGAKPEHVIDEYFTSRNLAKYRYEAVKASSLQPLNSSKYSHVVHYYLYSGVSKQDKIAEIIKAIELGKNFVEVGDKKIDK